MSMRFISSSNMRGVFRRLALESFDSPAREEGNYKKQRNEFIKLAVWLLYHKVLFLSGLHRVIVMLLYRTLWTHSLPDTLILSHRTVHALSLSHTQLCYHISLLHTHTHDCIKWRREATRFVNVRSMFGASVPVKVYVRPPCCGSPRILRLHPLDG